MGEAFPLKGKIKEGGENKMEIKNINGLTVQTDGGVRIVRYYGDVCPMVGRTERLCEQKTSYNGCVLNSTETYRTPVGIVRRCYSARGAGLDHISLDWTLVSIAEHLDAQARYEAASLEMAAAKSALEMLNA